MRRLVAAAIALALLFVVSACTYLKEPPATIYPSRQENPSAYKIDPLP
jgi:hypothetical protein